MADVFYWVTGETITATKMNKVVDRNDLLNATNVVGIALPDNDSTAFTVKEGTRDYLNFDTTDGDEATEVMGNRFFETDVQLTGSTADGFAATPTAIYNMDATGADAPDAAYTGTKVGAYDLTVKAESLASGADALGNAKYCQFAGSGYLLSTNAVFNFSGTFALGFKMFFPDWTPASAATIISNADAANAGCRLDLSTAGVLTWYENGVAICSVNVSGFDATKFYGGEIWRDAANVYILIDGVIVASGVRGTIAQKAVFQISGYNGATQLMPAGSRVDEVFVDFVNTHTADTLRNIYARSAKKFAVKAQDGTVSIAGNAIQNIPYETGTWTPVLTTSGGSTVPQYSTASGRYTRIGNRCFVDIFLTGDGGNEGSGVGAIAISLPFTVNASANPSYDVNGWLQNGTTYGILHTYFEPSKTTLDMYYWNTISTVARVTCNMQNNATRTIRIKGWYEI